MSNTSEEGVVSNDVEKKSNVPMTEEERAKLAVKLDEDLDAFISGLEKRSYQEGWPVDKWEEEMEKHPFFMTKSPEAGTPLSPLLQGLQDLKYDTNENTPEELALTHKEDGNFNYKCKNYRLAIVSYSEGLKQKCSNPEINAQLYNNRSASHYFLKNYRSCLNDCKLALKLHPNYEKTLSRAANCSYYLKSYDQCLEYCNKILEIQTDSEIVKLRNRAITSKTKMQRDERKKAFLEKKSKENTALLLQEIKKRKITLLGMESENLSLQHLEPNFPEVVDIRVHLEHGRLVWPVMILYPEYRTTDFIQEFHEDSSFSDHLEDMYSEPPAWDEEKKYNADSVSIYFEDEQGDQCLVEKDVTLGRILSHDRYRVDHGTPAFIILVNNSIAEIRYLNQTDKSVWL